MPFLHKGLPAQNVKNSQDVLKSNALKLKMEDMESTGYQDEKKKK